MNAPDCDGDPLSATTENQPITASLAPSVLAVLSIAIGSFVPFIGLPTAMVSVVAVVAADIKDRRLRYLTIAAVVAAIGFNLALVMVELPAARLLVESAL